jgi:putative transcriptional regulator
MSKRELFEELQTGLQDAKTYEEGKLTLKNVTLKKREQKILTADEIRNIRKKYNMSRALFANYLHISPRTLEKWELGTSKPNEQASTLLALTDKYPDMFDRLETV